jgi:hypothetical protein
VPKLESLVVVTGASEIDRPLHCISQKAARWLSPPISMRPGHNTLRADRIARPSPT